MNVTAQELDTICAAISSNFDEVAHLYSETKYPPAHYDEFRTRLASGDPSYVEPAMKWKWGHWGKQNYPQHHQRLISEIASGWQNFVGSDSRHSASATFAHWRDALGTGRAFISVAFITHLMHPYEVAIVDQHNFRAMNHLLRQVRVNHAYKVKPRSWNDVIDVSRFLTDLSARLRKDTAAVDRYLMMYGKHRVPR